MEFNAPRVNCPRVRSPTPEADPAGAPQGSPFGMAHSARSAACRQDTPPIGAFDGRQFPLARALSESTHSSELLEYFQPIRLGRLVPPRKEGAPGWTLTTRRPEYTVGNTSNEGQYASLPDGMDDPELRYIHYGEAGDSHGCMPGLQSTS